MKEKLRKVYDNHELLRLGTMDLEGFVNVRSVDFTYDPENLSHIYFTTFKATNKVKELSQDNRVYIVIDKSADSIEALSQIKYVRGLGKAYEINEPEQARKAMGLLLTKYPFLTDLPGDPSMMGLYRIELEQVKITDNSLGFGHVDIMDF
ncbi:pyridoxamine 5'-phosphate oxidase family protein [Acidaminobacter sp. JC074]|uniref:pyridoxamine 5'-phosphate oxidase family protein n=1 Tax=Acidaminobacter sp. JC074 TaxID=2530199 RepID=UPI001F118AFE|nr:pyridoxamine 5'-phosphate oxidase family protein [Acidaminobacter sp. JC074]MCH4888418.1 pyridoxamine 5'-phosphate oxidase family protein [Acidaminobacter sp. JC074]